MNYKRFPNDPNKVVQKYWDRATKAYQSENYSFAKKWFHKTLELQRKKERSSSWVFLADCNRELGNPSEALRLLRLTERYYPNKAWLQIFIGRIHLDLAKLKLAEKAFRKAIKKHPSADAYIFLGSTLSRQGRFREAKSCYQAALRLEPNNEEAHYNLGVRYREGKQYKKAERHLRQAIEIDYKYALAYAELGTVLLDKGLFPQARSTLMKSIKFAPKNYWARLYLANANWHLRRLKEAENQYRAAIKIAPSEALPNSCLGDFLSCEQKANAEYYLKNAIAIDPGDEHALYNMGKHLYRNHCDKEALFYLKKAARKGHEKAKNLLINLSQ